jgi:ectoine hydroxylase-related dioxygenase (phytanoyl-CoA dioxygenase family)
VERVRHPWNTDFTWREHRGGSTVTPEQARQYDELGFFVVEDAFDVREMARLDQELASGDAQVREFLKDAVDGRFSVAGLDTQVVAPHAVMRSAYVRAFAAHPLFGGIANDLIGPNVRLYWDQSVYKQPNSAEPVLWHQDNGYTYVEPQSYVTCWVALTDATLDNGCIAVVPGVHRRGTLVHRSTPIGEECWGDWSMAVDVPVRAGSVVVFTSLTPHATKRNATSEVRKAYILQYAPDGALILRGDPALGPPSHSERIGDDRHHYWIVRAGELVSPA